MREALLALLLPASSQAYARKYGKKRCPCVNATLDTYGGTDCHYAKYTASDADPTCFAPNYGTSCGPWDGATHSACLAEDDADEPAFCGSSFCYVNATECIGRAVARREHEFRGRVAVGEERHELRIRERRVLEALVAVHDVEEGLRPRRLPRERRGLDAEEPRLGLEAHLAQAHHRTGVAEGRRARLLEAHVEDAHARRIGAGRRRQERQQQRGLLPRITGAHRMGCEIQRGPLETVRLSCTLDPPVLAAGASWLCAPFSSPRTNTGDTIAYNTRLLAPMTMRTTALFVASLAACASALSTTKNQRAPSLALKGESTAALKEQLRRTAAPTQNGVGASERTVLTVEAIAAELESRRDLDAFPALEGAHELVFSTSTGASSGKLGPFVGHVTQTFLDEKTFVNAVELGPLKVALTARREPLDMSGWTYRVTFESMGLSLFGVEVGSKRISGGGTWNIRYVDDDLRIMDAPSLFVLSRRRDTTKSPTLLEVLDDPAKFMEDDD